MTAPATVAAEGPQTARRISSRRLILRRFGRNLPAVLGGGVIVLLIVAAVLGPHLVPWSYDAIDPGAYLQPPSGRHWFGTTQSGRDVLALTVHGLGKSLLIGFLVAAGSTGLAAVIGTSIAYIGGWYEKAMLWVVDLLLVIPSFFLVAIITSGSGESAWIWLVALLAGFGWMLSARVVRALTLTVKEREYILAARYMGVSTPRIIRRHILPNISSLLIVDATLNVGYAILAETGLSYFGFGVQSPDTSLGTLIAEGARSATTFPWIFLGPSAVLLALVLSVNAVGDGLRDALDPSSGSGGRA
ncbi:ABC transporter permease [Propionicicella superfundia]|uniref:ABC transporter permease n=1 Tax=Propionicicella superfundia TaxID=348582 RepID=UPI0003FC371B|nr:ABC transporter permease [Propionicicella superfundia]